MRSSSIHRLRRFFGLLIVMSLGIAMIPRASARVSAADEVSIPKPVVDQTVWITNWKEKVSGAQRYEKLIFDEVLMQQFAANPNMDPLRAVEQINAMKRDYETYVNQGQNYEYKKLREKDFYIRTAWDIAKDAAGDTPVAGAVVTVGKVIYEKYIDKGWEQLDAANQVVAADRRYGFYKDVMPREDEILEGTLRFAQANRNFATAYDMLNMADLNASIKQENTGAAKVIADNPQIGIPQVIRIKLQPDGRVLASLNELKQLTATEFNNLHTSLNEIKGTLSTIDAQQQDMIAWMDDQTKRQQAQALAEAEAARHQHIIAGAKSSVYVLSSLIGFIDPAAGRYISVVGESTIQVVDSVNQWMKTFSGFANMDMLGAMSTAMMTGNVLGAVMNIAGLFMSQGPTPEQMILEAIGQLRQDISSLRQEMHGRFDRIDHSLNEIYDTLITQFNKIDLSLWRINGTVGDIQTTLIAMELQLNRMERNTYEFLDVLGRRPLLESINGAIGYEVRTGLPMTYDPTYIGYENTFYSWAASHSFDALAAGPSNRSYADTQVLAELSNFPMDANINYLNGWLVAHGLQPFASGRLPGTRDWALSSSAYSQIVLESPDHARRIAPARSQHLQAIGQMLQTSLRGISTIETQQGPAGNTALFRGVLDYYNSKAAQLNTSLAALENTYVAQQQQALQRAEPFDLWGGAHQQTAYVPAAYNAPLARCDNVGASMAAPALAPVLPRLYAMVEYLKIGTVSLCYTASWQEEDWAPIPGDPEHFDVYAKLQVEVDVRYNGGSAQTRYFRFNNWDKIGTTRSTRFASPYQAAESRWSQVKSSLESSSQEVPLPPEQSAVRQQLNNATAASVQNWLLSRQSDLYGQINTSMQGGALKGAADSLGGAKLLLDHFISVGLPLAAEHDDYLRQFMAGNQQLADHTLVMNTYAAAGAQPLLTANPRTALKAEMDKRYAALDELIMQYLNRITAGEHSEFFTRIESTQLELSMTDVLARTETVYKTFIPRVMR